MIGLDFDGTVANYGDVWELSFNGALLEMLPHSAPVAIITNQGGLPFSVKGGKVYPTPERLAERLRAGVNWLNANGHPVQMVCVSVYHPSADAKAITSAAHQLRKLMPSVIGGWAWRVYETERARKPSPLMLKYAQVTSYYGDGAEDVEAARAAGVMMHYVNRHVIDKVRDGR